MRSALIFSLALGSLSSLVCAQGTQSGNQAPLFQASQRGDMPYFEEYTWIVAGDLDGDGDLDILAASSNKPARILLNNGRGGFSFCDPRRLPSTSEETVDNGVRLGDVDGDGDLDVLIAHGDWRKSSTTIDLWTNNGKGYFTDQSAWRLPAITARTISMVDVDGDKDLDIICGRSGKQNLLLRNDGKGVFSDVSASMMPKDTNNPFAMATGDVDKDGDMDLVIGTWSIAKPRARADLLYLNDGKGKFSISSSFPSTIHETRGVTLFDWDGDGDLDCIAALGQQYNPQKDVLYLNDGKGVFAKDTKGMLPVVAAGSRGYKVADIDKDGKTDLFLPGTDGRLLMNKGSGKFKDMSGSNLPADPNRNRSAVFGDWDKDGDKDLMVVSGNQIRLLTNDGKGKFSSNTDHYMPFHPASAESVAFGDVDQDGDIDIVVASYPVYPDFGFSNKIYINDGSGRFTNESATRLPVDKKPSTCIAIVDVDGDKDMDLVFGNEGSPALLYLNNGKGKFTAASSTSIPKGNHFTYGIEAADFDKDGDMDLVLANWGKDSLFLNDGKGNFSDASVNFPSSGSSRGIEVGDLDGDGDLDVLIGHGFFDTDKQGKVVLRSNGIMLNDGKAKFTAAPAGSWPTDGKDETLDLALGDIDGDGDLDVYEATGILSDRVDNLYLNNGKGKFVKAGTGRLPYRSADRTFSCLVKDFDGDGDLDIYAGKSNFTVDVGAQNRLYLNDGKGYFRDATNRLPQSHDHTNFLAAADVDDDGDLDIISASYYEPQLYLNRTVQIWAPDMPSHKGQWTLTVSSQSPKSHAPMWVIPLLGVANAPIFVPGIGGHFRLNSPIILGVYRTDSTSSVNLTLPSGVLRKMQGKGFGAQALVQVAKGWQLTGLFKETVR